MSKPGRPLLYPTAPRQQSVDDRMFDGPAARRCNCACDSHLCIHTVGVLVVLLTLFNFVWAMVFYFPATRTHDLALALDTRVTAQNTTITAFIAELSVLSAMAITNDSVVSINRLGTGEALVVGDDEAVLANGDNNA